MASTIGTTDLDALPLSPQTNDNIQLHTQERRPQQQQQQPSQQHMQQQQQQPSQQHMQQQQQPQQQQHMQQQQQLQQQPQQRADDPAVMQKHMNQFVTGLQQASAAGMTGLPSRDIPQNAEYLVRDPQMQPNYIPPQQQQQPDYIRQQEMLEQRERPHRPQAHQQQQEPVRTTSDFIYDELQVPILIAVLYFLFQLPFVRNVLFKYLPQTFNGDGSQNLSGYICSSVLFGALYLLATKGMAYIAV
jgi:hypothetical protein